MMEIITRFIGKKIEITCGPGLAFKGTVVSADDSILEMVDEDERNVFISIEKIVSLAESVPAPNRPGFLG